MLQFSSLFAVADKPPAWRMHVLIAGVLAAFGAVIWQLSAIGNDNAASPRIMSSGSQIRHAISRPDTVDRNGVILASDVRMYWLFADPSQILSVDDAAEKLAVVLKGEDENELRKRLAGPGRFAWIKRGITPIAANAVHNLGLPGLYIIQEPQRAYPAGATAVHILGHTNIDNEGQAGIEKFIDTSPRVIKQAEKLGDRPRLQLSVDLRVQYALYEELTAAVKLYKAKAAGAVVLDVTSGEVIALAGLPDYDPNRREESLRKGLHNRFYYDAYELGSVFKTLTVAMALDEGIVSTRDHINVKTPLRMGRFTIRDNHARTATMTPKEIFTHSSNTGAARLALMAGAKRQLSFFKKLGLTQTAETELGPTARPLIPDPWREINTMTAAYGHGISVPPFTFAVAVAALINGGYKIEPTFLPRSRAEGRSHAVKVLHADTSAIMRDYFRANVKHGTGRRANVPGYRVGGKTGTAFKPVDGKYSKAVISSFIAAFPMDKPQYLVFVVLDEPKPANPRENTNASYNAVPTTGKIIGRIAPMLGIAPARTFDETAQASY
ncbi:MAG: penicillin-binding protein 2 [Alphaproteobacteria bacterium]